MPSKALQAGPGAGARAETAQKRVVRGLPAASPVDEGTARGQEGVRAYDPARLIRSGLSQTRHPEAAPGKHCAERRADAACRPDAALPP